MAIKQNNFYLRWQEAQRAEKHAVRQARLRWIAPAAALVTVCLAAWAFVAVRTALLEHRAASLRDWCYAPAQTEPYIQTLTDQQRVQALNDRLGRANGVWTALDSQTDITSSLLNRVRAASSASITVVFKSYDADNRQLVFDARSSEVIDIPAYIRALEGCGVFSQVTYTGYSAQNDLYTINLSCVVALPAEKEAVQ